MLAVLSAVLYAATVLVVARLVRLGRLSGRNATVAVVGLAPLFAFAYVLLSGGSALVIFLVGVASLLSALPLYQAFRDLMDEQVELIRRGQSAAALRSLLPAASSGLKQRHYESLGVFAGDIAELALNKTLDDTG